MSETKNLIVGTGMIAYDVIGEGPLIVVSPGMADTRHAYRFLAPLLADAGYRVASVDLRGHGESSVDWPSYTHVDSANDLAALITELGGPAVIVGQSFSGGVATILAADHPDLVSAVVEIGSFTRPPSFSVSALLRNDHGYARGAWHLGLFAVTGRTASWAKYLGVAYPGAKPADWDSWLSSLLTTLAEPGRVKAAQKMINAGETIKLAGLKLAEVHRPVLIIMGAADSDFADPAGEARAIASALPAGVGRVVLIPGSGHYPHAEYPQQVADAILTFLAADARA